MDNIISFYLDFISGRQYNILNRMTGGLIMKDIDVVLDKTEKFQYRLQEDGTVAIVRCLEEGSKLYIPEYIDGRKVTTLLGNSIENNDFQVVFIPKTVLKIEDAAFLSEWIKEVSVDENNPQFQMVDGMLIDVKECSIVFCPPENSVSVLRVPSWIRSVRDFSFSSCVNLKQVILPEGLESIGCEAFEHCEELTDIYIPSTVTHLGDWAFDDCPKLTLWLHRNVFRRIWGYFREFSNLNVELVEEEPSFFRMQGK